YLANEDGSYILNPNPDPAKTFGAETSNSFDIDTDFGRSHDALAASGGTAFADVDGELGEVVAMQVVSFDPRLADRHWLLVRTIPESAVLEPVNSLRTLLLAVGAGIAVLAVLAALWMSRQITAPLAKMGEVAADLAKRVLPNFVDVTQAVASGDLTKTSNISVDRIDIASRNELGQMAGSFNEMGEQLEAGGNSLNKMVEGLRTLVGQMARRPIHCRPPPLSFQMQRSRQAAPHPASLRPRSSCRPAPWSRSAASIRHARPCMISASPSTRSRRDPRTKRLP
ncbi:MAG TPA: methyl-accepting chemotaxis protein, partial [SAR202 cluster bacterium]|nr:methyl-accepting chemotaxis protein [SAR202 cluster bacterium]